MMTSASTQQQLAAPDPDPESPSRLSRLLAAAIPAGYGVLIALLVALGIQGDVFTRLLRNEPGWMAFAFGLAIVGATLPLVGLTVSGVVRATAGSTPTAASRIAKANTAGLWLDVIGAVMLLAGVIIALIAGILTFSDREQPTLKLASAVVDDAGNATLAFEATALSLSTEDTMLLRVVAVPGEATAQQANDACRTTGPSIAAPEGDVDNPAVVLFWGQSGPTSTGATANTATVRVPQSEANFVCALAALSESRTFGKGSGDSRFISTLVDITNLKLDEPD